jgi:hypothetical protein
MPLDRTAKEYAAMLYQKEHAAILENHKKEMQAVVVDFSKRNMTQSGMYFSARAKIIGKHVGLMAVAMAQSLSQAYERAGLPLNQTTLQEITVELDQFCEGQKRHLQKAAHDMLSRQNSPAAPRWAESLAQTMESELAQAAARAKRDLSIKHHEILLEQVGRR